MASITEYIDIASAAIRDARSFRGEAVFLTMKPGVDAGQAISAVISDLVRFMSNSTGKMYHSHRESYSKNYRIEEPGHPSYGLKVVEEFGKIYIQPIAVLEDTDILRRYVQRLRRISASQSK
jgi:hypothetical protein